MNYKIPTLFAIMAIQFLACKDEKLNENKLVKTESIAVKTYKLVDSKSPIFITTTGFITTENEAKYAFKLGGVIDKIYVKEGEVFKKGQLLASLKLDEIEAGLDQAKLGLEKAERDLRRVSNLYKDSVATLEQLQNTTTAYEVAKKQFEALRFNKSYASINAFTGGFVSRKLANEGEIIAAGSPVLFIQESNSTIWVLKLGLSDKNWSLIEKGNKARVELDAFPGKIFGGTVTRKSMAAELGTGSFEVEVKFSCEGISPASGMFGKAQIETNIVHKYTSIPYDALIEADGDRAFVFVPLPGGKVKKQEIEIADFDQEKVRVKTGLENVSEIVISNSAFLNSQSTITIIP